jgi:hypothetical protein
MQWNAVADSRFGTLVIRHRIQSNSAMGKASYYVGISGSATIRSELVMLMVFLFTSTCFSASRRWTLLGETFNSTYGCVAIDWNESQQELALRIWFESGKLSDHYIRWVRLLR